MKLVITGGGSGGHIQPLVAIASKLQKEPKKDWEIFWLGSKNVMERQESQNLAIPFYNIPAGKWRRYFDWHNFSDIFKTVFGIIKAYFLLQKLKPDIIFSKGGFVSFPTVIAGWLRHIPIVAHESDVIPGLTTKLCLRFVTKQCVGFTATQRYLHEPKKLVVTGIPLREMILQGDAEQGLSFLKLTRKERPIVLILGGSLGAKKINDTIAKALPELTKTFTVVHMTGIGKQNLPPQPHYYPFPVFKNELADMYQVADIIISRAGATTVAELLSLHKKAILIPLGKDQSRGDQIINAKTVAHLSNFRVLPEEQLQVASLMDHINQLLTTSSDILKENEWLHHHATENVIKVLKDTIVAKT